MCGPGSTPSSARSKGNIASFIAATRWRSSNPRCPGHVYTGGGQMSNVGTGHVKPRPRAIAWRPRRLEKMIDRLRYRSWFEGKEFSSDWASNNFTMWRRVLSPLRDQPVRILEIGSWEGRSALFFLNFFKRSTIVCIDTFEGTPEEAAVYALLATILRGIEDRFDRNLAALGSRVEKYKSRSGPALERLSLERRRFD